MNFGQHLTLDLNQCNIDKLKDISLVYETLNNLPKKIGMKKMTLPYVVKWLDNGAKIEGISGFVMIAESHIAIHTFPEKYFAFADIFSCRNFNTKRALNEIVQLFDCKKYDKQVIKRGFNSF